MKKGMKIGLSMIFIFVLICMLVPTNVAAKSGTLEIEADYYDELSLGKLSPGDEITYSWDTSDEADSITFLIGIKETEDTPDEKIYNLKEGVRGTSGSLTVDIEGTHVLVFNNDNIMDTAYINYEYTITKAPEEQSASAESPGFELFGAVLAISLCIGIIGWRRRKE